MIEPVGVNGGGEMKFNAMVEAPAYFVAGISGTGKEECLANALLVAAAPELLEALEIIERIWSESSGHQVNPESPLGIVRAAIAKAKGQA